MKATLNFDLDAQDDISKFKHASVASEYNSALFSISEYIHRINREKQEASKEEMCTYIGDMISDLNFIYE